MKPSVATAHFRRLSCLGLEGRQAVSAMLGELASVVPGAKAVFVWTDADGAPRDAWLGDASAAATAAFFNEHERFVGPGEPSVERCIQDPRASLRPWKAFGTDFIIRSDTFQDVWRPCHMGHMISIPLRHGRQPVGLIGCYRDPADVDFSATEEATLIELTPYLNHAVLSADEGWDLVESEDRGVIVCDPQGRILSQSAIASRLMIYAVNGHLSGGISQMEIPVATLPRKLAPISAALARIAHGDPAPPPRMTIQNRWGLFEITAQPMTPSAGPGDEADLVCLIICRKEPLPLRLARRLRDQPISERQKQLALHLALNRPTDEIRDRMGIGPHTYRDHLRAIYAGLGVSSRTELLSRLLV